MIDLGPHAAFVWASYIIVALVLGGLIAWVFVAEARHRARLSDLERRGIVRRSRMSSAGHADDHTERHHSDGTQQTGFQ